MNVNASENPFLKRTKILKMRKRVKMAPIVDIFMAKSKKYTKKLLKYLSIQLQPLTFATPIRKLGFDYVSTNQDQITIIRSQPGR